jgi:Flp pilus assembly protein CpaB
MPMDVPQARRVSRPAWVNVRTVTGLLIFSLAFLAGRAVLSQQRTTNLVWAATHDLSQDATLGSADVRLTEVKLSPEQLANYLGSSESLEGAVLTRPVRTGELISAAWVAPSSGSAASRSMSIPVAVEHATGGDLRTGDRIDVVATFNAGDPRARTQVLLRAVEVLDVVTAGGLVVEDETVVGVTVAVTPEDAARLAFAIRTADIDIAKVTGAAGSGLPKTIDAGDFE